VTGEYPPYPEPLTDYLLMAATKDAEFANTWDGERIRATAARIRRPRYRPQRLAVPWAGRRASLLWRRAWTPAECDGGKNPLARDAIQAR